VAERRRTGRERQWTPVRRRKPPIDFWRLAADLSPVTRRPLAAQVADQVRRRIATGDLRPGQRIESSRKLALELQVSMPILREALAALSYLGMIEVRHGVGIFISQRQRVARVLRVSHRRAHRAELHALRATITAETASLAASRRRTEGQRLDLHLLLEERLRSVLAGEPTAFIRADLNLHAFVAGIAGSPLQAALERMTGVALTTDMAGRARRLALDGQLNELHRTLVEAIDESDPEGARNAAKAIATAEGAAPD
jgi:GntR family transcriptional regulator, transcriptional repressor for pyruvate dehydrogenase complex